MTTLNYQDIASRVEGLQMSLDVLETNLRYLRETRDLCDTDSEIREHVLEEVQTENEMLVTSALISDLIDQEITLNKGGVVIAVE